MLPCYEGWGCDLGVTITGAGGLCPALPGYAPLRCVESWKGALPPPTSMQDLGLR